MALVLRGTKGSPLTHEEMDGNLENVKISSAAYNEGTSNLEFNFQDATVVTADVSGIVDEALAISIALG